MKQIYSGDKAMFWLARKWASAHVFICRLASGVSSVEFPYILETLENIELP